MESFAAGGRVIQQAVIVKVAVGVMICLWEPRNTVIIVIVSESYIEHAFIGQQDVREVSTVGLAITNAL
jgi:hypothetical protein